nr:PREDICTED: uncharacterized protein LOC106706010 [Latimeria chalumnae]|eukprot:XP_014351808.1 PREDICTED: uncharacterized protein LOC106706010 [Latimeria chalumnae]
MPGDKTTQNSTPTTAINLPQKWQKPDSPATQDGNQPSSSQFVLILQELIVVRMSNAEIYNEIKGTKANIADLNCRIRDAETQISSLEGRFNEEHRPCYYRSQTQNWKQGWRNSKIGPVVTIYESLAFWRA